MRAEKHIGFIKFIRLTLNGMGKIYFVPYLFLFIFMPIASYADYIKSSSVDFCYFSTYVWLQVICPFISIWWTLFGFREYIEGSGREALLVYKRGILPELITVFLFYFLHIVVLLALYNFIVGFNYFGYIFIYFTQSFAFFAFSLSLAFIVRNISIPFIICIIYEIFCMGAKANGLDFINMLSPNIPSEPSGVFFPYVYILAAFIILLPICHLRYNKL